MLLRVLSLILLMCIIPFTANAADPVNDFEVEVLPADGQKNFSEGYFHLDSKPGETLSLEFRVTNNSTAPIRLQVGAVDAYTADKGGILYGINAAAHEEGDIRMAELIDVQETVTVTAGDAEDVHVHVAIPEEASGTILGGIMLTTEGAPENLTMASLNKGGSNYTFEQIGQRIVAVKLNLPGKSASGGFSVDKAKFDAAANQVTLKVKNGEAKVLENVQGTYSVMDKEGEVLLNGVVEPFSMAPQSDIDFPIDLKGILLEEGKYVLMIKGRADEKEFFAEEKFTVTESEAAGISSPAAESNAPFGWATIPLTIAVGLGALLLLLPMILKLYKRNEKRAFMKFTEKNNM